MAKKKFDTEEALQKAMELFWVKGYEATSVRDLTTHLGITIGSFYDSFGSKHTIFMQALKRYNKHFQGALIGLLDDTTNGKEAILQFFQVMMANYDSAKGACGCLLTNSVTEMAAHDPEVAGFTSDILGDLEAAFARAYKRGQEQGHLDQEHDAKAMGSFLNTNFQGMNVLIKARKSSSTLTETVAIITKMLN